VDVVAVRPDELDPEGSGEAAQARHAGRGLLLALPFLVLAALIALVVILVLRTNDRSSRDDARQGVLQAARQEAVNLTTLSYTSATRDLDRILAGATGGLRAKFESERAQFPAVLAREKSQSSGSVLSAGLVRLSLSAGSAQVVLATDATVATTAAPQPVLKHYRMVMTLQRVNGHWLVSDVAFAGLPQ
jgi:Mce-associated membrane protein